MSATLAAPEDPLPAEVTDPDWAKAACDEARRRFETAEKRLDEMRGRARTLCTAVGGVLALELTATGKLLDLSRGVAPAPVTSITTVTLKSWLLLAAIALCAMAVMGQVATLARLIRLGFGTSRNAGFHDPRKIADKPVPVCMFHVRVLEAYARAAAEWDETAGHIGKRVAKHARLFGWSMALVVFVILLLMTSGVLDILGVK